MYPAPCKGWVRGRPRKNHTSASDSRSEAADWARGWCGDHFGLFGASVRGRAAELEACAGWPARAFRALLCVISGKPGRAGTTKTHHGGPVRGMSLYKESRCTFLPLSSNISRRLHLLTHRVETLGEETNPTRSEGEHCWEDLQAKTVRRTPLFNIYLIHVLCSLFFALLCTGFDILSV